MAQLSSISFDQIGSIVEYATGSISIGPSYDWQYNDDSSRQVKPSGPFESARSYLQQHFIPSVQGGPEENEYDKAESVLMDTLMNGRTRLEFGNTFVLCPPDFDSRNIMVDEQGNVTGIIHWDLVQTMPRCLGSARYTGWITRDWDLPMYGWPHMTDSEDSPETLVRYRAFYNEELGKALKHQGDWRLTENSHIAEAVWIAALNRTNRLEICRKFVQTAVGEEENALFVIVEIGEGEYDDEEWGVLEANLKQLVS